MTEELATAVHECSHTVAAFLFGVPQMHVALTDEKTGETVPECAICHRCVEYYWHHNPHSDAHAKAIQDDFRKDAAVAMAGEIGEEFHTGIPITLPLGETNDDRCKVRSRAAAIHYWSSNQECYEFGEWRKMEPCGPCDTFIDQLRTAVRTILQEPAVATSTLALAHKLVSERRLDWDTVTSFLSARGLTSGPAVAKLPPAP